MSEGNTCSQFGCTFMATEECAECGPGKQYCIDHKLKHGHVK
jgi:hypothetical protein